MSCLRCTFVGLVMLSTSLSLGAEKRKPYPNYPVEPTVIEYEVDPAWPKKPADLPPMAAVPGIVVDKNDQVWVAQRGEIPILVFTTGGDFVKSFGKGEFVAPHSLRIDRDGNLWITDFGQHTVKKVTPDGKVLLTLGVPGQRGEDETHFSQPTDAAVTPEGDIFVTDGYGNRRVVHFDKNGKFIKQWGTYGSQPGQFVLPHAVVLDSKGTLYVADRNSGRVEVFDQQGKCLSVWSHLIMPWGLWMSAQDELWICGSSPQPWRKADGYPPPKDQLFAKFSTDGRLRQLWAVPKGEDGKEKPGETNWVHCIALDRQGNLYVGDINGKRAQKFVRNPPLTP